MRKSSKKSGESFWFAGFRRSIYVLPGILFFSYYPIISFGSNESMNFELSLPLIWLVAFDAIALILLKEKKKFWEIFKSFRFLLLPVFLSLSILWSQNVVRGILTAGVFWLVYLAGFAVYTLRDAFRVNGKEMFYKWFLGSSLMVCLWCFLQCVLDLAGFSREATLMCAGCTYKMFGFPHPNGFAIEPQFMGNLLLAPAIVSAWMYILTKQNNKNCPKFLLFCFFVFVATLFLTFSRGAIYAFIVAMVFMTGLVWSSKHLARDRKLGRAPLSVSRGKWFRAPLKVWLIIAVAFLFTLNVQGIMAQVSPTSDTYWSGVSKVLNHLSLGIIDLRVSEGSASEEVSGNFSEKTQALASAVSEDYEEAMFDGYVAESTDTRLRLSGAAIQVWKKDFWTVMFGVGLGGAGQALYDNGLSPAPKEIVQNEYISLLLEIGIVGVGLVIWALMMFLRLGVLKLKNVTVLTLLVAYAISLLFFSGLPNALQIYILPVVLLAV